MVFFDGGEAVPLQMTEAGPGPGLGPAFSCGIHCVTDFSFVLECVYLVTAHFVLSRMAGHQIRKQRAAIFFVIIALCCENGAVYLAYAVGLIAKLVPARAYPASEITMFVLSLTLRGVAFGTLVAIAIHFTRNQKEPKGTKRNQSTAWDDAVLVH